MFGYFRLGDDTYIYLQYAKHILKNGEISFNLGFPSYGFTGPFWLGLIVLLGKIFGLFINIPTVLSFFFGLATIIVWYFIIKNYALRLEIFLISLVLIAVDPNLLKHAYLGMEATASYFFSSCLIYISFISKDKTKIIWLGICIGLFHLIRPESVIISTVLLIYLFYNHTSYKKIVAVAAIVFIIILPWYLFAHFYFDQLFPNTFYAKGASYTLGKYFFKNLLDVIKIFIGSYFLMILYILAVLFNNWRKVVLNSSPIVSFLIIGAVVLFYTITISNELVYSRYLSIIFPFLFFIFFEFLQRTDFTGLRSKKILIVTVILSHILLAGFYRLQASDFFLAHKKVENKIIEWVNGNTCLENKIIRGRIGEIGFYTDRHIIDPMGLINGDIIPYNVNNNQSKYYELVKPDYYIGYDANPKIGDKLVLRKKIIFKKENMARDFFLSQNKIAYDTLRIYKVKYN